MTIIKPVIQYRNVGEFREYVKEFVKNHPDAEDLLSLDYSKCDGRTINGVELLLAPKIGNRSSLIKSLEIQTGIETNLDVEWFAKRTELKKKIYGELIMTEYKEPSLILLHHLAHIDPENPEIISARIVQDNLQKSAYEMNKTLRDLFEFYGISDFREVPFVFDFQRMKKIREGRFY